MGMSLQRKKKGEPEEIKLEVKKGKGKIPIFSKKNSEKKEEYTLMGKKKAEDTKGEENSKFNTAVIETISPMGVEFGRSQFAIGENDATVMGAVRYPVEAGYGWLSQISNIPSTIFSVDFESIDGNYLLDDINSNIKQAESLLNGSTDHLEIQRLELRIENAKNLMKQIDQNGEKVGMITTSIMPYAPNEEKLSKVVEKVKAKSANINLTLRKLAFAQEDGFKMASPFHRDSGEIKTSLERVCPLSSFVGGFPFSASGYSDGTGSYLARDLLGGLLIIDLWKREGDRTNSNFVLTGVPGVGKSTALKHIILSEYMKGTKILIIDPEGEYRDLTKRLSGEIINAGGGKSFRLNPLHIRPVPRHLSTDDLTEEGEEDRLPDLASYMNILETFFQIYLKLSPVEMAILKEGILELYAKFGISFETDISALDASAFPIMQDLLGIIQSLEEKEVNHDRKKVFIKLRTLLRDSSVGKDSFLWNGSSTATQNSRITCFDTSGLGSMSANTKTAQYFNITNFCWQIMSHDREEKVMLICDEAYLLIDPDVPQTLSFIRDVEKRNRKYNSALGIASHSIVDFLDDKVKRFGQAVLDLPTYKFIMGTDGQNLKETKELYNLNEAEELFLEAKQRKRALAFIGSKRLPISFDIPVYKFEYFGDAGGK